MCVGKNCRGQLTGLPCEPNWLGQYLGSGLLRALEEMSGFQLNSAPREEQRPCVMVGGR